MVNIMRIICAAMIIILMCGISVAVLDVCFDAFFAVAEETYTTGRNDNMENIDDIYMVWPIQSVIKYEKDFLCTPDWTIYYDKNGSQTDLTGFLSSAFDGRICTLPESITYHGRRLWITGIQQHWFDLDEVFSFINYENPVEMLIIPDSYSSISFVGYADDLNYVCLPDNSDLKSISRMFKFLDNNKNVTYLVVEGSQAHSLIEYSGEKYAFRPPYSDFVQQIDDRLVFDANEYYVFTVSHLVMQTPRLTPTPSITPLHIPRTATPAPTIEITPEPTPTPPWQDMMRYAPREQEITLSDYIITELKKNTVANSECFSIISGDWYLYDINVNDYSIQNFYSIRGNYAHIDLRTDGSFIHEKVENIGTIMTYTGKYEIILSPMGFVNLYFHYDQENKEDDILLLRDNVIVLRQDNAGISHDLIYERNMFDIESVKNLKAPSILYYNGIWALTMRPYYANESIIGRDATSYVSINGNKMSFAKNVNYSGSDELSLEFDFIDGHLSALIDKGGQVRINVYLEDSKTALLTMNEGSGEKIGALLQKVPHLNYNPISRDDRSVDNFIGSWTAYMELVDGMVEFPSYATSYGLFSLQLDTKDLYVDNDGVHISALQDVSLYHVGFHSLDTTDVLVCLNNDDTLTLNLNDRKIVYHHELEFQDCVPIEVDSIDGLWNISRVMHGWYAYDPEQFGMENFNLQIKDGQFVLNNITYVQFPIPVGPQSWYNKCMILFPKTFLDYVESGSIGDENSSIYSTIIAIAQLKDGHLSLLRLDSNESLAAILERVDK